jgi:Fe-S cluster assembly protein SufB
MNKTEKETKQIQNLDNDYPLGFNMPEVGTFKTPKGINEQVIKEISARKGEPAWMLEKRLQAFEVFKEKSMPTWGADLSSINFDNFHYYIKPEGDSTKTWDDVPDDIKNTFDKIGIPQAEREYLSGVKSQYDSEVMYGSIKPALEKQGVLFLSFDEALKLHPEIIKQYFGTIIPATDNKFAALNTAVWSGGSFVYIPENVKVTLPLQAYFRINSSDAGQFERTLIIAEKGASVHYTEGCSAPAYSSGSLHSAVVEIIVKENAKVQYTTIQNWYKNVYNLVTKRAIAHKNAHMSWVDCNLGSKITMKYPSVYLVGEHAHGEILSIAFAGKGQHQDAGGKIIHNAPNTTSLITSKSICKDGGRSSYRGLLHVAKNAKNSKSKVVCDALILDDRSETDTYPTMDIKNNKVKIEHEATVSKVSEKQLFYLTSRGLSETEASSLIVNGFIEPIVKELPMEYAVELNRLIKLEMTESVG